jgi:hypothetical protein
MRLGPRRRRPPVSRDLLGRRVGELLPSRRLQAHPQQPEALRRMAGHQVAEKAAPLAVEAVPAAIHHPHRVVATAVNGRDRVVQPRSSGSNPLPLPGRDPRPLGRRRTAPDGRNHGEPGASRGARRVRRAARGNGPAAMPAPRPVPTQPPVGPSPTALPVGSRLMIARYRHLRAPARSLCGICGRSVKRVVFGAACWSTRVARQCRGRQTRGHVRVDSIAPRAAGDGTGAGLAPQCSAPRWIQVQCERRGKMPPFPPDHENTTVRDDTLTWRDSSLRL